MRKIVTAALAAGAVAVVALAWTARADAGTLERKTLDGQLQYVYASGASETDSLVIARVPNGPGRADDEFAFANASPFSAVPMECAPVATSSRVECPVTGIERLTFRLGSQRDTWESLEDLQIASSVDGGVNDDTLLSRGGPDVLLGGDGKDSIKDLSGVADGDTIDAGPGNDWIENGPGRDDIHGGPGVDGVVYVGVVDDRISLDDVANDGAASGESDNVHSDVETVGAGGGDDVVVGSPSANRLNGGNGDDRLDGGGGDDELAGSSGADELIGGPDIDRADYPEGEGQSITLDDVPNDGVAGERDNVRGDVEDVAAGPGDDVVVGSGNANTLDGGPGADDLTGGGGGDTLFGGNGLDVLRARDGLRERVDCGADGGAALVDTTDDVTGCGPVDASFDLIPDVDGDRVARPPWGADCNDFDARIHPGALDVPGNAIDENCNGKDAPFPSVHASLGYAGHRAAHRFARITVFTLTGLPANAHVTVTCKAPRRPQSARRSCAFRRKTFRKPRARLRLVRLFKGRSLGPATITRVTIGAAAMNSQIFALRVTRQGELTRTVRCATPGGKGTPC